MHGSKVLSPIYFDNQMHNMFGEQKYTYVVFTGIYTVINIRKKNKMGQNKTSINNE